MFKFRALTEEERNLVKNLYCNIVPEAGDSMDWTLQNMLEKFLSLKTSMELKVQDENYHDHYIPLISVIYDTELSTIAKKIILPYGFNDKVYLEIDFDRISGNKTPGNIEFNLHAKRKCFPMPDTTN